jgi:DNA adenine methylase
VIKQINIQHKVKTCLRYPGGKFYGIKNFKKFLEIEHDEYREPFVGGATVYLSKRPADRVNWINDIDSELINFYNIIKNKKSLNSLLEKLKGEVADKKRHKEIIQFKPQNELERAFKYFYLNRTSFIYNI